MSEKQPLHQPVMLAEALDLLQVKSDCWYIDATFGRGGHTQAILDNGGTVIAFDMDKAAIKFGKRQFAQSIASRKLFLVEANFTQLKTELNQLQQEFPQTLSISGILFDFGTTQDQLKSPDRGFSFNEPESKLDMRMNLNLGVTATDLLTVLSVKQLTRLFKDYGGEVQAKKIAQAIERYRGKDRSRFITTVGQLVKIIEQVKSRYSHLHPATKVFQALRIAVNDELGNIQTALPLALDQVKEQGRLVTIAFHQGEDRIVKHQFKDWQQQEKGQILTDKPLTPTETEVTRNPASRSAKLRAFLKDNN